MGFYPATSNQNVAGLLTVNGGLVVNAPETPTTTSALVVNDTGTGRSGSAQLVEVFDIDDNPIFAVPTAGGPKSLGDRMGSWSNVFALASQMTPWGALMIGGSTGPSLYGGTGAPLPSATQSLLTDFDVTANVGDFYIRQDGASGSYIYICTTAGNPGTWADVV